MLKRGIVWKTPFEIHLSINNFVPLYGDVLLSYFLHFLYLLSIYSNLSFAELDSTFFASKFTMQKRFSIECPTSRIYQGGMVDMITFSKSKLHSVNLFGYILPMVYRCKVRNMSLTNVLVNVYTNHNIVCMLETLKIDEIYVVVPHVPILNLPWDYSIDVLWN